VIRRILVVFAALTALLARAETSQPELSADKNEYVNNEIVASGHAELRDADLLLTADEIRYNRATDEASATGHVVYTRGAVRVLADKVVLHRRDQSFSAEHIRLGSYPYYIEGRAANGSRQEVTVFDARIAYGEPGPWQPTAKAGKVIVSPGHQLRFENAQLGIGHAQPLPLPEFQQSLSDPLISFMTFSGGYRGSLGAYLDAGLHLPVAPGLRLGGDVGYYTARGLLAGPSGSYADANDPEKLHGVFHSGYINDHGDKGVDVLGRPISENRAFAEWQHQQQVTPDLSLAGQLNWWRDSEVVRDFRPREFFPVQQPDNFVEATYEQPNFFVSAFTRFAPNSFEIVQQRLPEVRFDLMPIAVGPGFVERFNASIAVLRENPLPFGPGSPATLPSLPSAGAAPGDFYSPTFGSTVSSESPYSGSTIHDLRSTRFDAYYSLSRPIAYRDWFALTPVAGARVTHYMDTEGAAKNGSYTRGLGEIGADAELHTSGTFAYKNDAWHIDGIRHLFTPRVSYRYIPEADRGQAYIPEIDRQTFSTYLQPLGLGDVRNIDELRATNTLRLEFDNTLQTRDPQYGTRDLLRFNVADDFRFKRQFGERDVSEIHTELTAMPARWVDFGFYNSFAPQTFTMREFNSGITLHDGTAWTVRFSNNFLRHELHDYYMDLRARLNEEYDVIARLRYDQRTHRFNEQAYGIVQNLANTWRISYLVSLYSGPRRESHFGLSVQIDTVRF
jgi:LPS-assembly protein